MLLTPYVHFWRLKHETTGTVIYVCNTRTIGSNNGTMNRLKNWIRIIRTVESYYHVVDNIWRALADETRITGTVIYIYNNRAKVHIMEQLIDVNIGLE